MSKKPNTDEPMRPYWEGYLAANRVPPHDGTNPHTDGSSEHRGWARGFKDGAAALVQWKKGWDAKRTKAQQQDKFQNIANFQTSDLVEVYGPASLGKVWPGNHVMLRSGGPCMIVSVAYDDGTALCAWTDDAGKLQSYRFKLCMLTCYGAK